MGARYLQCEDTRLVALQRPDVGAKRWTYIIRHRTNELLKHQNKFSDVQDALGHGLAHPASGYPSFRPGFCESTISARCCGQPKTPSCIVPMDWLTKDLYWPGLLEISECLKKEHSDIFRDVERD
jgi:hypothetical protein